MAKGAQWERDFCTKLSLWWTDGRDDNIFWRTAGSGGRATRRGRGNKKTEGQYGDVMAVNPDGLPFLDAFTVELKKGYSTSTLVDTVDRLQASALQTWEGFLHQAIEAHEQAGSSFWMLGTCRVRRSPLVSVPWEAYLLLKQVGALETPIPTMLSHVLMRWRQPIEGTKQQSFHVRSVKFFTTTLEEFFNRVTPQHIRELVKIA